MINSHDIIIRLREVRKEKNLSYGDIMEQMEKNGDYISKATLSRLFNESTTDFHSFKYEETIRPIAKVLLDMETIEETDDLDTQALKSLLKYKIERIEELECQLDKEKVKYHEKLDKERAQFHKSLDFLKEQVALKDKRIDTLMDANTKLMAEILECPRRKECGK